MGINPDSVPGRGANVVSLSDTDAEHVSRLLRLLSGSDEPSSSAIVKSSNTPSGADLVTVARRMFALRRKRFEYLPAAIFGELAWDILLLLYIMEGQQRLTVGAVVQMLGCSGSTTSRWIDYLEMKQLVARSRHPTDLRVMFIALTQEGRRSLGGYLSEAAGLSA